MLTKEIRRLKMCFLLLNIFMVFVIVIALVLSLLYVASSVNNSFGKIYHVKCLLCISSSLVVNVCVCFCFFFLFQIACSTESLYVLHLQSTLHQQFY